MEQPRKLTSNEVESFIKEHAAYEKLRSQLNAVEICDSQVSAFFEEIRRVHRKSVIQPGTSIGIIASQCIAQPTMQLTLNTFHNAGKLQAFTTSVLKQIESFLNMTKKMSNDNRSLNVYFTNVKDLPSLLNYSIVHVTAGALTKKMHLISNIVCDTFFSEICAKAPQHADWGLEVQLLKEALFIHRLTPFDICLRINQLRDDMFAFPCSTFEDVIKIVPTDAAKVSTTTIQRYCQYYMPGLIRSIPVGGIEGVKVAIPEKDSDGRWYYITKGGVLMEAFQFANVDRTRLVSNDPREMCEIYGYTVAKDTFIAQFYKLLSSTNEMHPSHIELLADNMFKSGKPESVSRHSMNNEVNGPLSKIMFEQPLKNALEAASFGSIDDLSGTAACIAVGNPINAGTGFFDLLFRIEDENDS